MFCTSARPHDRFAAILREHRPRLRAAVVHCFTGSATELDAYLEMDLHIGITGWICDGPPRTGLRALIERNSARPADDRDRRAIPDTARSGAAAARRRNERRFSPRCSPPSRALPDRPAASVADDTTRTARAFFGIDE